MKSQTPQTEQNPSEQPVADMASPPVPAAAVSATPLADSIAEAAYAPAQPPLSDGGASLAAYISGGKGDSLLRKAYVGVLAFIGIGASFAVGVSYLPLPQLPGNAQAQVAATVEPVVQKPDPFAGLTINARAAYVYDAATGKELYARNADTSLPLASITKVALMLAVSEVLGSEETVTISDEALERGGGGLIWGEIWRARDLIDFTLIASSNAGAEALAEAADAELRAKYPQAPTSTAAVWRMNKLADELGMARTHFVNVSGLDMTPVEAGAIGSARDVATLFAAAIRTDRALFSGTTRSNQTFAPLNFPERTATNTNNALADFPGIIMGKTGTTDLAGGNLAIAFNAMPERPVIIVILGSGETSRYDDMRALAEAARTAVREL